MTMRGTPYYYNGDELGMTNAGFDKIEDYRDMPTLNEYQYEKNTGGDLKKFLKRKQFESRDNGRTPFQWNSTMNAGFTNGTPWLKVNPNYKNINAAAQENNPNSCLNYFRSLVKIRNNNIPVLVYGKYNLLDRNNSKVYAYTREGEGKKMLIILNFSASNAQADIKLSMVNAKLILSNYTGAPLIDRIKSIVTLKPYQAVIYKL
jgi:oligo-1,6-glucosidase